MPRAIMWCSAPGASNLSDLGILFFYRAYLRWSIIIVIFEERPLNWVKYSTALPICSIYVDLSKEYPGCTKPCLSAKKKKSFLSMRDY